MEMHAYDRDYLENAQKNLGNMMDYAVNTCEMDGDDFFGMFIVSGAAGEFGRGNPGFIVGMTGCELTKYAAEKAGLDFTGFPDELYLDKSPESWCGWALAYYQWFRAKSFERIINAVSIQNLLRMYITLHEADIQKFVEVMDEKINSFYTDTNLKRIRTHAGYSQSELAKEAGVSLRQIQLLEQRQRDINKAQAGSVMRLARALGCGIEDLLE